MLSVSPGFFSPLPKQSSVFVSRMSPDFKCKTGFSRGEKIFHIGIGRGVVHYVLPHGWRRTTTRLQADERSREPPGKMVSADCNGLIQEKNKAGPGAVTRRVLRFAPVPPVVNAVSSAAHKTAEPWRGSRSASCRTSAGDDSCLYPEKTTRRLSRSKPEQCQTDPKPVDRPPSVQSARARYRSPADSSNLHSKPFFTSDQTACDLRAVCA